LYCRRWGLSTRRNGGRFELWSCADGCGSASLGCAGVCGTGCISVGLISRTEYLIVSFLPWFPARRQSKEVTPYLVSVFVSVDFARRLAFASAERTYQGDSLAPACQAKYGTLFFGEDSHYLNCPVTSHCATRFPIGYFDEAEGTNAQWPTVLPLSVRSPDTVYSKLFFQSTNATLGLTHGSMASPSIK
jgi:hypothetical protein